MVADYEGKKFVSIQKADVKLEETEDEIKRFNRMKDMYKPLTDWWKEHLTALTEKGAMKASGVKIDGVVLFEAPDETLVKRLSGRRSCPECGAVYNTYFSPSEVENTCDRCRASLIHRADDEPETVTRRLQVYLDQTAPLVAFYDAHVAPMARIVANRAVDDIYGDFKAAVVQAGGGAK